MRKRAIEYLLDDLCVQWGFCLPPAESTRIADRSSWTAEAFAVAVVEAEGMDAERETTWVSRIAARFRERFGAGGVESRA